MTTNMTAVPRLAFEVANFTDETPDVGELLEPCSTVPAWRRQARCRVSEADFFPSHESGVKAQRAKAVCVSCPSWLPCFEYALAQDDDLVGIWAATTQAERRALRRQNGEASEVSD